MTTVLAVAAILLCAQGGLAVASLLRARSLGGRVIALDTALLAFVNGLAVHALWTGDTVYLDVMIVTALLVFVGVVAVSRFIEDRR